MLQGRLALAGVSVAEVSVQGKPSPVRSHADQLLLGRHGGALLQKVAGGVLWRSTVCTTLDLKKKQFPFYLIKKIYTYTQRQCNTHTCHQS